MREGLFESRAGAKTSLGGRGGIVQIGLVQIGLRDEVVDLDSLADLRRQSCDVVCGLGLAKLAEAASLGSSSSSAAATWT